MHKILRGATVVDGTGGPARRADVEVDGGRIVAVGDIGRADGAVEIDLDGLVLAPGIIDPHTHLDVQMWWDPDMTPSNQHGVTTVVQGNTGFGLAPTRPEHRELIAETFENVEDIKPAAFAYGLTWSFETFGEYMAAVDRMEKRCNIVTYIGHTPLRFYVMGPEASEREATEDEVATMAAMVKDAVGHGAIGVSTSQAASHVGAFGRPVPSRYASPGEIRTLLAAGAAAGGRIGQLTYGPHYGLVEAAKLSKELGIRMTWGSLLSDLHGPPGAALALLDEADAVGGDVWPQISARFITIQVQLSGSVNFFMPLDSFGDVLRLRGKDRMRVYRDPAWQERARREANATILGYNPRWERFWLDETEQFKHLRGRSMAELGAERGMDPFDVMLELALAEELDTRFRVAVRNYDPGEVGALLRDKRTIIGAHDAGAHVDILCDACYPTHVLGRWVRDEQALGLEEAVWRMTGQIADVYGLADRGKIVPGLAADLFAFDPQTVADEPLERLYDFPGTTDRLVSASRGVHHVWVNGEQVRRDEVDLEGARPGRLLV